MGSEITDVCQKNNNSALVTVVIPIYNGERYLKKCIESVTRQTYSHIEIILVDGGSEDNSAEICDSFKRCDDRIIVIHQANSGVSAARNSGIDIASGEFISFVDCDDFIAENMIEVLVRAAIIQSADIAMCGVQLVAADERCLDSRIAGCLNDEVWKERDFWRESFGNNKMICVIPWNKLYRKNLFKATRYEVGKIHEDEWIIHELIAQVNTLVCVKDNLYYYRQHSESIMGVGYSKKRLDRIEAQIRRAYYFENCNEQQFAEKMIKMVVGLFVEAYLKLDMKDNTNIAIYKELRKKYSMVFLKIARKSKSIVFIINGMSFLVSTNLYIATHRSKILAKNEGNL